MNYVDATNKLWDFKNPNWFAVSFSFVKFLFCLYNYFSIFEYNLWCNDLPRNGIQIMNVYKFNGAIIFMSWKIKLSIQRGEAKWNRMFNLSTDGNNSTIERMERHSLFVLYNH